MTDEHSRYLVPHHYGMGALWWWVRASLATKIVEACAEVEVITGSDLGAARRRGTFRL